MAELLDRGNQAGEGFRRVLKNIGWLLGGKGFGAVCSLVYLAILSRSLGVKDFGHFSLIFGTAQALTGLAGFQTWQTVVRFGAPDVLKGEWDRFGRLAVLGAVFDGAGAIFGCAISAVMLYGFGAALDLNQNYVDSAFIFICVLVWARGTAALGVLRVLDRYDLAVAAGAITPAARLVAAVAIWLTDPTVERFLFAWGAIELFSALLYWTIAWRLKPEVLRISQVRDWRRTMNEHPGILRFLGLTYLNSSVISVLEQGPLMAVGYFLGTSAAGVYRLADQLAKGLSKLATLATQALYPEVNRQRHSSPVDQFRKLVRRINLVVIATGVVVVGLTITMGETLLVLIGGSDVARGGAILLPLAVGAAFELASVSYEPVLHATGHPSYPPITRMLGAIALIGAIFAFVGFGPVGIGWAVALGMAVTYLAMSVAVLMVLPRERLT
jgi:O-antigen/teichoic acid export membrane protein